LAEAVGDEALLLVLDEVERIAQSPASLAVIEALVRYAPPGLRLALASRRELPLDIAAIQLDGRAGVVDERDLALTEAEAAQALHLLESDADPHEAVKATGGWIAGVMFEAWREGATAGGARADPLHGYLARNLIDEVSPEERELLLVTSVFREVTAQRTAALGIPRAGLRLSALRARHLPATWHADPLTMRCHPRFREYLLEQFQQSHPERAAAAHLEYARLMQRWGHPEEAVEAFLSAGAPEEGVPVADTCVVSIVERLDFDVAERWFEAFAGVRDPGSPGLVTAELMISVWTDDNERGTRLGDRLNEVGERDRLAESSPLIAALFAWCYGSTGIAPAEARRMLEIAPPGTEIEAVRYTLTLADDRLADPDARPPALTGGPIDVGLLRAHYHRGELALLAEEPPIGWEVAIEPWRILALGALGQTGRALERYERANPARGAMWMAGLDLMIDLGRHEDARALLELAPKRTRSNPLEHRSRILEARIALRAAADVRTARRALTRVLDDARASSLPFLREHADTWLGFAELLEGRDADALARLRTTVTRM
jgi:tetratricopeptide (TPR) repeat protein